MLHTIVIRDIAFILKGFRQFIMPHITIMSGIIHNKKETCSLSLFLIILDLSLSISRVLSCTVIYLGLPSPASSSDIHGVPSDGQPYWRKPNLAASGVYMAYCVTTISVSSYLAFPSLPHCYGGLFLLHCPWSRLHLTLSGTLSYAARTFLIALSSSATV